MLILIKRHHRNNVIMESAEGDLPANLTLKKNVMRFFLILKYDGAGNRKVIFMITSDYPSY
jgi:hypothetical protein